MEKLLKNKNTALWITFVSILVLVFKTAPVFHSLSFPVPSINKSLWFIEWVISIISVTVIEIAVLLFISRGNKIESYLFAVVSFFSSVYYFNEFNFVNIKLNIMQVLWSLLYPFIIVRFSHFYNEMSEADNALVVQLSEAKARIEIIEKQKDAIMKEKSEAQKEGEQLKAGMKKSEAYLIELKASLQQQQNIIKQLQAQNEKIKGEYELIEQSLKLWIDRHTCRCGKVFDNVQQLSGHKKGCSSVVKTE